MIPEIQPPTDTVVEQRSAADASCRLELEDTQTRSHVGGPDTVPIDTRRTAFVSRALERRMAVYKVATVFPAESWPFGRKTSKQSKPSLSQPHQAKPHAFLFLAARSPRKTKCFRLQHEHGLVAATAHGL
jgi:hypothetical protein